MIRTLRAKKGLTRGNMSRQTCSFFRTTFKSQITNPSSIASSSSAVKRAGSLSRRARIWCSPHSLRLRTVAGMCSSGNGRELPSNADSDSSVGISGSRHLDLHVCCSGGDTVAHFCSSAPITRQTAIFSRCLYKAKVKGRSVLMQVSVQHIAIRHCGIKRDESFSDCRLSVLYVVVVPRKMNRLSDSLPVSEIMTCTCLSV
jgi:hypothetical protein